MLSRVLTNRKVARVVASQARLLSYVGSSPVTPVAAYYSSSSSHTTMGLLGAAAAAILACSASQAHCEDKENKGQEKPAAPAPVPVPAKMYYRMLGNTGLKVSVLSYGFWATFGMKSDLKSNEGVDMAKQCLRVARDAGINLFDNAEVYAEGQAEVIMGEAIRQLQLEDPVKWRRSDLIITTKIFWGGKGPNEGGLSRKHVIEGTDAALKRLQMSYVDLIFCHRPDPLTPTETVVRAMTDVVRSGRATAWGTSEWSAQQITEAIWIARTYGLEPPQFEQPHYNMFHRERFETEYFPIFRPEYNYGTTIWSPLASGLLTGKYNEEVPAGSRLTVKEYSWLNKTLEEWRADGKIDKVRKLSKLAEERFGCTTGQLAIAWCLKNKNVSTVLLGATKPEQLVENLGAMEVARRITDDDMRAIEEILKNKPAAYQGYGSGELRKLESLD